MHEKKNQQGYKPGLILPMMLKDKDKKILSYDYPSTQ